MSQSLTPEDPGIVLRIGWNSTCYFQIFIFYRWWAKQKQTWNDSANQGVLSVVSTYNFPLVEQLDIFSLYHNHKDSCCSWYFTQKDKDTNVYSLDIPRIIHGEHLPRRSCKIIFLFSTIKTKEDILHWLFHMVAVMENNGIEVSQVVISSLPRSSEIWEIGNDVTVDLI